jgi:hypothetical protein
MHRHSPSKGKQSGIAFHSGTAGEGMRAAIEENGEGHAVVLVAADGTTRVVHPGLAAH